MSIERQRGLSLIELIIFMVIMGVAAAVILQVMNFASRNSADPVRHKQALLLAEAYLEEVEMARFTYCDPTDPKAATAQSVSDCSNGYAEVIGQEAVTGAVGRPYDNVSDYSGVTPGTQSQLFINASNQLTDVNGTPIDTVRLADYTVTVGLYVVSNASPLGPAGLTITSSNSPANLNALRIMVQVKYGSGSAAETVTLDGYRTRYAPRAVP